jgi:hypothetical protein
MEIYLVLVLLVLWTNIQDRIRFGELTQLSFVKQQCQEANSNTNLLIISLLVGLLRKSRSLLGYCSTTSELQPPIIRAKNRSKEQTISRGANSSQQHTSTAGRKTQPYRPMARARTTKMFIQMSEQLEVFFEVILFRRWVKYWEYAYSLCDRIHTLYLRKDLTP